ncbi:MAG: adenosylmethionine--8-amino-7-oxononanoate transaminase [Spirochaetia bacterium]|nr:adenosylmethionine--8-amino-7-oxononanoate transaminase [Spirochaetia bacterium]
MLNYSEKDQKYIWHPFTQSLVDQPPVNIVRAKDSKLYAENGQEFIDAISSWWVNLHGHAHPVIKKAISDQMEIMDQIIFAGFTHPTAIDFAEELLEFLPGNMAKVFYSDNGSTSVEVAVKMALQYWHNQNIKKQTIIAFHHSYHGDTFGSMSISQRGAFNDPFSDKLFDVEFISSPGELSTETKFMIAEFSKITAKGNVAAFIYEPLIQGAGGMLMYEPDVLDQLLNICRSNEVIAIADEVMTGFGRTGKFFASEYMKNTPDIICLSKGITGGILPLGATACTKNIYENFKSNDRSKTFFHGHSYTGNSLSLAAARASLTLLRDSMTNIKFIEENHKRFILKLKTLKNVQNIRSRGTILAFDVDNHQQTSYFNSLRDNLYHQFIDKGVLIRPLGNVIYLMPPYCIDQNELDTIYNAVMDVLSNL